MPTEHDPKTILQIKDQVVQLWKQLPIEHQATFVLVLLKQVQEGAYGEWMTEALNLLDERKEFGTKNDSEREFRIPFQQTSISRDDLLMFFKEDEVALLTDRDLERLALMLANAYVGSGIMWDDLKLFARQMLEAKKAQ